MLFRFRKLCQSDPRLIGMWQSDADATIAEIRKARPVTPEQEEAMRKSFGKMKITYTDTTCTTDLDGDLDTLTLQVIRKDEDSVVVKVQSGLSTRKEEFRIRFEGSDTYWVDVKEFGLSECFRRIQ